MKKIVFLLALLAITSLVNAGPIFDARILGVTAVAPMAYTGTAAVNIVNGSGIDEVPGWADYHSNEYIKMWHGWNPTPYDITLTLPDVYTLQNMKVWNFGNTLTQGIKEVTISFSTNGTTWNTFGNHTFAMATSPTYFEQVNLNDITAKYIKLTGVAGNAGYTDGWYGVSEIAFYGQIPEPTTMVLISLGGLVLRRMKK
ncbi:MAG: discoidin domain-containing protein [Phycisphaerales bacterium]